MKRQEIIMLGVLAGIVIIGIIVTIVVTINKENAREQRTANVSAPATEAPSTQIPTEQPSGNVQPQQPAGKSKITIQPKTPAGQGKGPSQTVSSDLKKQIDTAIAGTMPVMLDFGATWCPACKQMKPIVDDLEKNYSDLVKIIYIDIDKNQDLTESYNISAVPTQIFFKDGQQAARHEGVYSKTDILNQLKKMGVDINNKQRR